MSQVQDMASRAHYCSMTANLCRKKCQAQHCQGVLALDVDTLAGSQFFEIPHVQWARFSRPAAKWRVAHALYSEPSANSSPGEETEKIGRVPKIHTLPASLDTSSVMGSPHADQKEMMWVGMQSVIAI